MPKTATIHDTTATTMTPTKIVIVPPLTADRTCPPMIQSMVAYPTMRTMLRNVGILDGQYPKKYLNTTCIQSVKIHQTGINEHTIVRFPLCGPQIAIYPVEHAPSIVPNTARSALSRNPRPNTIGPK